MAPRCIAFLVCAALFGCASRVDEDPRVARISEQLHLAPPYMIDNEDRSRNGAAWCYTIRGGNRRRQVVCWDGAVRAVEDFDAYKKRIDSLGYGPPDTIPRLLYLDGPRSRGGRAIALGSPEESTLIDLLRMAAERELGVDLVARIDSVHALGSIEAFGRIMGPLNETQRRYAGAVSVIWGVQRQRERGYWLPSNVAQTGTFGGSPR